MQIPPWFNAVFEFGTRTTLSSTALKANKANDCIDAFFYTSVNRQSHSKYLGVLNTKKSRTLSCKQKVSPFTVSTCFSAPHTAPRGAQCSLYASLLLICHFWKCLSFTAEDGERFLVLQVCN